MNFSFSGCGFLGLYHVGVAAALKEYAPDLVIRKIAGASGGAIAACALTCDLCLGQTCSDIIKVAMMTRQMALGPLHPSFNLTTIVRDGLNHFLPDDAHKLCSGRLYVSLTRMSDGENVIVNEYQSKDDLVDAIICSAFIPFYSGTVPPTYRGVHYIDGGWSNNLPILDEHTVTVSPFSGEADICPADPQSGSFMLFDLKNTTIRFTSENLYRVGVALFPPHPEVMSDMCRQGFEDTLRFLARHDLISCTRCIAIRSSIILSETSMDETSGAESASGSRRESSVGVRVLPKSFTDTRWASSSSFGCQKCQETAERAPKKGLPRAVRKSLSDASAKQSSLLGSLLCSRPFTVLRYMMLPWMLPVDFFLSYFKKLSDRFPSLYETATDVASFLLKHVETHESSRSWKLVCQMAVTELNFSNLSSELAETFGMFEPPKAAAVQPPTLRQTQQTPPTTLLTTEMNFGFAVNMNDSSTSVQRVSSIMATDKLDRTDFQACDVSRMVDDLEWAGFQRAASKSQNGTGEAGFDADSFDTLGSILDYSRKHDALMSFYYLDDQNRMKMTEFYGISGDDDKQSVESRNADDSGLQTSHNGSSTQPQHDPNDVQLTSAKSTKIFCASSTAPDGTSKMYRRSSLSKKFRKPKSTIPCARPIGSESDTDDMLFVPGRSRPFSVGDISYEGGSSDASQ